MPRWPALPRARSDCLLQRRSSRSVLTCRKPPSWSSSTPNALGLPSFTNCAGASAADPARRPACFFTRRRSEKSRRRVSPFCAKRKTAFESRKRICDYAAKATYWERDKAALVLRRDPTLSTPRGEALRHLLYLFGKDEAIKLIRAG